MPRGSRAEGSGSRAQWSKGQINSTENKRGFCPTNIPYTGACKRSSSENKKQQLIFLIQPADKNMQRTDGGEKHIAPSNMT